MTTGKYSQPPEKRIAFLERVEHYVNKSPMWTPAEGALLVNGIMPPPKGCVNIPDDAAQLDDPVQPASQGQLLGARMLLRAYRKDVDNGDASPAERITSDEFLKWCQDGDFLSTWTLKLAEFLRHLYFPGHAYNQYPQTVEDELGILRMAMVAKTLNLAKSWDAAPSEPDIDSGLTKRSKQINAILAGAEALDLNPEALLVGPNSDKEKEHKRRIREWCKTNYPKLFGGGDDPFDAAWKKADFNKKIIILNKAQFTKGR